MNNIKYTIIAKTIFTIAPAATIAILFGILALLKEPSSSERSSSPSPHFIQTYRYSPEPDA